MALSKETMEAKPKKPQNVYMKFRMDLLKKLGDKQGKNEIVKAEWNALTETQLEDMKK